MKKASDIGKIHLDDSIYRKPSIMIYNKDNVLVKKINPDPDKAWNIFVEIVSKWEKAREKELNEDNNEKKKGH